MIRMRSQYLFNASRGLIEFAYIFIEHCQVYQGTNIDRAGRNDLLVIVDGSLFVAGQIAAIS